MWVLDSVGPFRTTPGGYKHILVAVNKFTKSIEIRPVTKVTSEEAAKFIQDITRLFGVPNRIITNLGTASTGSAFWDFCQDNMIDVYYSSVAHTWCNGQVERANGMVLQALKECIFDDTSNYTSWWLAELPHVIWGPRIQVSSSTGFLPFSWSTTQKPSYPLTSPSELHVYSSKRREKLSTLIMTTSTASRNKE
jgi:hypothetical protein